MEIRSGVAATGISTVTDGTTTVTNAVELTFSSGAVVTNLGGGNAGVTITGGGTVTSFSSGNLSPLFTTSVATPTSTPSLSFTLSTAAANSIFGNNTGSSASPAYNAATSYSDAILGLSSTGLVKRTGLNTYATATSSDYVSSVSNSDGTLTISPTTGAVVASLNLANANTWTAQQTISGAPFVMSGNQSAPFWSTNGIQFALAGATYTDTTSSGTVSLIVANSMGRPKFAASSATTYTDATNLYLSAATSGTNATITNPWALYLSGGLTTGGTVSRAAWGLTGAQINTYAATYSDTTTAASGTATNGAITALGIPTIDATHTSVTYTNGYTFYIAGAPVNGANVTITNKYALYSAGGFNYFGGAVLMPGGFDTVGTSTSGANLQVVGGTTGTSGNTNSLLQFGGSSTVAYRSEFAGGNVTYSLGTGDNYGGTIFGSAPLTTFTSGTHAVLANVVVNPLGTVTSGGATVTTSASLYVQAASSGATTNYALYVNSGTSGFGGYVYAAGGIGTTSGGTNANFYANATNGIIGSQNQAQLLFGGASNVQYRNIFNGNLSSTLATGTSYSNVIVGSSPVTTFSSGTHAWLNQFTINPIGTVTSGGASVTNTATLYLGGAGSGGTNNYAFYVNSGNTKLGGGFAGNVTTVADTAYTALITDYIIAYTSLTAARTVTLATTANYADGQQQIIKDEAGTAGTNNITVTPASGTIDGAANKVINANYGVLRIYKRGSNFFTW